MRAQHTAMRRAVIVSALLLAGAAGLRAGDLNPPAGPVAPTMKSLTSVEPRTEVNSVNTPGDSSAVYVISAPGSYYLSGNVAGVVGKSGVEVGASDVTLDLSGFALIGVPGSGNGITPVAGLFDLRRITILNGNVREWGGLGVDGQFMRASRLIDLSASGNFSVGLAAGEGSVISRSTARDNGSVGIFSNGAVLIEGCTATGNGFHGIQPNSGSTIRDCLASQNASSGIVGVDGSLIIGCRSEGNAQHGIAAMERGMVRDCVAAQNSESGILTATSCTVTDCTVSNNAFDGIATGAQCVVESCTATDNGDDGFSFGLGCTIRGNSSSLNGYGFYDSGGGASRVDENTAYDNTLTGFLIVGERNLVVRNMARANGAVDYSVSGSSQSGEIVVGAIMGPSTGAWANFAESVNATGAAANKASDRRSQMPRLLDRADQSVQPVAGGANVSR